jgi:hemoglobin/transferrin/lactoferrin receptor protein
MHHSRLLVPTLALTVCTLCAEEATTVPPPAPPVSPTAAADQPTPLAVSATRLTSAPQDQPYAFYQHGRSELDHQTGRTAVESLNNTPGVFVQKTAGNQSSPYIRGLTGEQTLLLFDGVRLSNAMFRPGANQYSALIPDSSIGGIDVILGSSGSVTGSDGLTGAIDFRLAEAGRGRDQAISPWATARAGSADGYRAALGFDGRIGDVAYSLDGGYAYFHDLEGGKHAGDHLYGSAAGDDTIPNSHFHEYHFGGRVAYLGIDNNRFELAAGQTEQWDAPRADGYFENSGDPVRFSRYYDPQTFTYVHARHVFGGAGAIPRIQTTAYYHLQEEAQFREDNNGGRYRRREYEDAIGTAGLDLQLTSFIQRHEVTYGGTIYQDRSDNGYRRFRSPAGNLNPGAAVDDTGATEPDSTTVPDGSTYNGIGVFLQDFWRINDHWDLLLGARYSRYDWNFDVTAGRPGYAGIGPATIDDSADAITGNVRLGFSPVPPVYTFAGISQGFRAPNLSNLAGVQDRGSSSAGGQGPQVQGNPSLDAEKSLTYELGGRWSEQRDTIALTGFYTTIDDLIQVEYTDVNGSGTITGPSTPPQPTDDTARVVNTDEARLWGAEFSFDYGLPTGNLLPAGARLSLFNVTNWVHGEVDAFNTATLQVEEFNLSKANRLFGQAGVRMDLASGWWGLVRTRWSDAYDDVAPGDATDTRHTTFGAVGEPPGAMPGYAVLDAKIGWLISGGKYWIDLTVENLLNASYREPGSGTDGSGINAILAAGARF